MASLLQWGKKAVKDLASSAVNTVQTPYDLLRLSSANIRGNQTAANNARQALGSDNSKSFVSPMLPFERSVASAILSSYAQKKGQEQVDYSNKVLKPSYEGFYKSYGYDPRLGTNAAEVESGQIKNSFQNDILNRGGINQNDSLGAVVRKIGGQSAAFTTNLAMLGSMPNVLTGSLPARIGTFGGLNAATGVAETAQMNAPTIKDYLQNGAIGFGTGAAIPILAEGGKFLANTAKNAPETTKAILASEAGAVGKNIKESKLPEKPNNGVPKGVLVKKERGFSETVKESPITAPEVSNKITANYTPKRNDALVTAARKSISEDIATARKTATTNITDKGVATASELIKHYQALGDFESAINVAQSAARNLTEAGRTVQAAALYNRISPEGILRYTSARIEKAGGKPLSSEVAKHLTDMAKAVEDMPAGEEKLYATVKLHQEIANQIPSGALSKLTNIRKAGLLTGVKTHLGNAVSNATHLGLNKVSDLPAAAIDKFTSLFTGKRTKSFTVRGIPSGALEGAQKGVRLMKTGVDELAFGSNKYDYTPVNFKNPVLKKYTDLVFNSMGAEDKPWRYAALKNNLYDLAITDAKNKGLRFPEAGKHIKSFINDPPPEALKVAMTASEKAVFANKTFLSDVAGNIRTAAQKRSPVLGAAVDLIAPFTKVPSAVITRLFDYTPAGAIKEIGSQLRKGTFDQRAFAEAIGQATTGTAVLYIGTQLALNGHITGSLPTSQKERDLWELEGKQPNSILFGDKWYSTNYTSPIGQVLQTGASIGEGIKEGKQVVEALGGGISGAGKSVIDQSFLSGISGALDALSDPTRFGSTFIKQMAGSAIPTLTADIAKATDKVQRQTNTVKESVEARIPGLRQNLLPKQDAFGKDLPRQQGVAGTIADPFRTTTVKKPDQLTSEIQRLQDSGNGVLPNTSNKTIQVGNEKVKIDPKQLYDRNSATGKQVEDLWKQAIANTKYQPLADDKRSNVLQNILNDVNAITKIQTLQAGGNNDLADQLVKKLTARQKALADGSLDINSYFPKETVIKTKASKTAKAKTTGSKSAKAKKLPNLSFKTAKFSTPKIPKITVKKQAAFKAPATRKLAVSKIPTSYKSKRLA